MATVESLRTPLFDSDYGESEFQAVQAVLASKWLTMGDQVVAFENEFAATHQVKYGVAVSNCTAALHLAFKAIGVCEGDEVIVPALTFVATANAVIAAGGTPVFADISSEEDLCISPESVERLVTSKTKAVVPVHYAGYSANMTRLDEIARAHGLAIVEDCAHAPGGIHGNRPLGSWGNIGCFSFFSNKNISTGEGGMLTTDDANLFESLRKLRSHGMTTMTLERHRGHASSYDVVMAGYNYRMDEIHAALGRVQLKKLSHNNDRRRALVARYRQQLSSSRRVGVPFVNEALKDSSCHIMPVLLPLNCDREQVMAGMRQRGIQTSVHYPPIHQFRFYRDLMPSPSLPMTESVALRLLTLPLYPLMSEDAVDDVCSNLLRLVG